MPVSDRAGLLRRVVLPLVLFDAEPELEPFDSLASYHASLRNWFHLEYSALDVARHWHASTMVTNACLGTALQANRVMEAPRRSVAIVVSSSNP